MTGTYLDKLLDTQNGRCAGCGHELPDVQGGGVHVTDQGVICEACKVNTDNPYHPEDQT